MSLVGNLIFPKGSAIYPDAALLYSATVALKVSYEKPAALAKSSPEACLII